MPVLYCRHAATGKNIDGGTDDPATPLHAEGEWQAAELGPRLLRVARERGIRRIRVITSGHVRAVATWDRASPAFAGSGIEVAPATADPRIGEISFLPREVKPTPENPGLFGRVIDGPPLAEKMATLQRFDEERLRDVPEDELVLVMGHRSTTRLLAMIHAGQGLGWVEGLPRMNNCELWLANGDGLEVLHPGHATQRDGPDPRRESLMAQVSHRAAPAVGPVFAAKS